jgi:hypothetical protein
VGNQHDDSDHKFHEFLHPEDSQVDAFDVSGTMELNLPLTLTRIGPSMKRKLSNNLFQITTHKVHTKQLTDLMLSTAEDYKN